MSFPTPVNAGQSFTPNAGAPFVDEQEKKASSLLRGWDVTPSSTNETTRVESAKKPSVYAPLLETIRLYAGWLLAWYVLVFALGGYQATKTLPFDVPLVYGLAQSPLVLTFAFATFLFLLLSSLARALHGGKGMGVVLGVIWIVAVYAFRINL
jgi:hypothetical protein